MNAKMQCYSTFYLFDFCFQIRLEVINPLIYKSSLISQHKREDKWRHIWKADRDCQCCGRSHCYLSNRGDCEDWKASEIESDFHLGAAGEMWRQDQGQGVPTLVIRLLEWWWRRPCIVFLPSPQKVCGITKLLRTLYLLIFWSGMSMMTSSE